ncbi:winged helix-turn-helix domain-containing protein [Gemmata obscuriglobus]|nr:winged helix-turn-helix domain-containing protein [Gemmata obscuriglobus]
MSRPIGTPVELERRRQQAVQAVADGPARQTVATVLGVHVKTVSRWVRAARTPGGVAAKVHPGPTPGLTDDDLKRLAELLLQGAKAHGWHNQLWTAARVARLIEHEFHIRYHPEHVREILKRRLGWTSQKPRRKARERNDKEVARWVGDEGCPWVHDTVCKLGYHDRPRLEEITAVRATQVVGGDQVWHAPITLVPKSQRIRRTWTGWPKRWSRGCSDPMGRRGARRSRNSKNWSSSWAKRCHANCSAKLSRNKRPAPYPPRDNNARGADRRHHPVIPNHASSPRGSGKRSGANRRPTAPPAGCPSGFWHL